MPGDVLSIFIAQGLPGAVALVALWWAWKKDRDSRNDRKELTERIDKMFSELQKLAQDHGEEMKDLMERSVARSETWMDKYHELSRALTATVQAIERNVLERRSRDGR